MVDGFNCLRHNSVVCRYNKDNDVCNTCTPCSHCCEGLMARGVHKYDFLSIYVDHIGPYMLGNAACFSFGNI